MAAPSISLVSVDYKDYFYSKLKSFVINTKLYPNPKLKSFVINTKLYPYPKLKNFGVNGVALLTSAAPITIYNNPETLRDYPRNLKDHSFDCFQVY